MRASSRLNCHIYGYKHRWLKPCSATNKIPTLPSKIICVTQNYVGGKTSNSAASVNLFSKLQSSLVPLEEPILLNDRKDIHYESEMIMLIGRTLRMSLNGHDALESARSVAGIGIGLDLTKKDIQKKLASTGSPWEVCKGFDRACPTSPFIKVEGNWWEESRKVKLEINGEVVQNQSTHDMILSPGELLNLITRHFSLVPGDLVFTGTPVLPFPTRPLIVGDKLRISLGDFEYSTHVIN